MKTITTLLLVLWISFCNGQRTVGFLSFDRSKLYNNEPLDSVVAINDSTLIYYYTPANLWKDRYYALLKLRDYGYFRIPIHNRHKFRKAEKEYMELMKP